MEQTPMYQVSPAPFDALCQIENGQEVWSARDLQSPLGYVEWRKFEDAIERAMISCKNSGQEVQKHFVPSDKPIQGGNGAIQQVRDHHLSRYACYLTAMNGDPRKPEIAAAQTYFAVKTHEAEMAQPLQGVEVVGTMADAHKLHRLIYHLQSIEKLLYPQKAQRAQKQLPAPKPDRHTSEYIQESILRTLARRGPLTLNVLRTSYLKAYDEVTLLKHLRVLVEQCQVCGTEAHGTKKYELVPDQREGKVK